MNAREYVIRRQQRDWVALEMHEWALTRRPLGVTGWMLVGIAWLFAGYVALCGSMMSLLWFADTRWGRKPPLNLLETGALVSGLMGIAGLIVYLTTPQARRRAAEQRARTRARRLVRALQESHTGDRIRVRVTDRDLTETVEGTGQVLRRHAWTSIRRIDLSDGHLFVLADDKWLVYPAGAFADAQAFREFAHRVSDSALAGRDG